MLKDKLEVLEDAGTNRRTLLKGLLVGLGASVLVQAAGGVIASAQEAPKEPQKTEKGGEHKKLEKSKAEKTEGSKSKNEKRKAEEPKAQRRK